jgi:predicted nucleotidyltransferase
LEEEFIARAIEVHVEGNAIPVISPKDLIITKVLAGRPKDIEDVRGVLSERAETLDLNRIRQTLRLLETELKRSVAQLKIGGGRGNQSQSVNYLESTG